MGRHKYAIGVPCKRGHPYKRRGSDGQCLGCVADRRRGRKTPLGSDSVLRDQQARIDGDFARFGVKSLKSHPGPHATYEQLRDKLVQQSGRCGLTGLLLEGAQPQLDHKIAVSVGGSSTIDNLHWVHPMANMAKGPHTEQEFRIWLLRAAGALKVKIEQERAFADLL